MTHAPVAFADYEADTREIAEQSAAIIADLHRQLRDREIIMWAMVRAAGGSILVTNGHVAAGHPPRWRIDEDMTENGRRFTILP